MDLKSFVKSLGGDEAREAFARNCGTTLGHLKNVMYGYKPCATDLAVSIERETSHQVTRKELRSDWQKHWPELCETTGRAPREGKVTEQQDRSTEDHRESPDRRETSTSEYEGVVGMGRTHGRRKSDEER